MAAADHVAPSLSFILLIRAIFYPAWQDAQSHESAEGVFNLVHRSAEVCYVLDHESRPLRIEYAGALSAV